ncbi:hypothetical protein [Vibrio tasmaniensis]|uniref:hypothetical protein n=1 Tax=Vibrio tasmaniensis TaxID=212663 RepID=UPI00107EF276|nr:hypothetical protein [Vibrio tasmaniensis]
MNINIELSNVFKRIFEHKIKFLLGLLATASLCIWLLPTSPKTYTYSTSINLSKLSYENSFNYTRYLVRLETFGVSDTSSIRNRLSPDYKLKFLSRLVSKENVKIRAFHGEDIDLSALSISYDSGNISLVYKSSVNIDFSELPFVYLKYLDGKWQEHINKHFSYFTLVEINKNKSQRNLLLASAKNFIDSKIELARRLLVRTTHENIEVISRSESDELISNLKSIKDLSIIDPTVRDYEYNMVYLENQKQNVDRIEMAKLIKPNYIINTPHHSKMKIISVTVLVSFIYIILCVFASALSLRRLK